MSSNRCECTAGSEAFLASKDSNQSGGDRYLLNIHTDMDTLVKDGTGAESELEDRSHVPAGARRAFGR